MRNAHGEISQRMPRQTRMSAGQGDVSPHTHGTDTSLSICKSLWKMTDSILDSKFQKNRKSCTALCLAFDLTY